MKVECLLLVFAFSLFDFSTSLASDADSNLTATYRFQSVSVPPLQIDSVRIWVGKTSAFVTGEICRLSSYDVNPNDYVEVKVIDPHGKTLICVQTNYSPKPVLHCGSRYGNRHSSYVARLPFIPPPFSTIKVTYVRLD